VLQRPFRRLECGRTGLGSLASTEAFMSSIKDLANGVPSPRADSGSRALFEFPNKVA